MSAKKPKEAPGKNWGAEAFRAPDVGADEEIIFSECGRVLDNICYRSHYYRVVKPRFGQYRLIVKHGGGQEGFNIGHNKRPIDALRGLDSDTRYLMLSTIYHVHSDAGHAATNETARKYRRAFVDGTLKKRKQMGRTDYIVWIQPSADVS